MALNPNIRSPPTTQSRQGTGGPEPQYQWPSEERILIYLVCTPDGMPVIWGTLLQRLVPPEMIGRVASLDFFVSIAFMPVSIAIAGPLSLIVPIPAIFIVAGVAPTLLAIVALLAGRMRDVETRHPLDT